MPYLAWFPCQSILICSYQNSMPWFLSLITIIRLTLMSVYSYLFLSDFYTIYSLIPMSVYSYLFLSEFYAPGAWSRALQKHPKINCAINNSKKRSIIPIRMVLNSGLNQTNHASQRYINPLRKHWLGHPTPLHSSSLIPWELKKLFSRNKISATCFPLCGWVIICFLVPLLFSPPSYPIPMILYSWSYHPFIANVPGVIIYLYDTLLDFSFQLWVCSYLVHPLFHPNVFLRWPFDISMMS